MSMEALPGVERRGPATGGTGQHATKLERSVHSGWIAETLREAIIEGRIAPQARLVEQQLARQLGVSRGPVRNALNVLESEGLVRTLPNGRTIAVGFGEEDVEDLTDARLEIETAAIVRGIRRGGDVAPVEAAFAAIEREGASTRRLVDLDLSFHRSLVELSGSRFLTQAWLALAPVIHTVITIGNRRLAEREPERNFARIVETHRPLVAAIAAGDAERSTGLLIRQFDVTTSMFTVRDDSERSPA
jgi:DNA-binding GntR family transcriptional regulator